MPENLPLKFKNVVNMISKENTELFLRNLRKLPDHIYWQDAHGQFLGCNDQQAKSAGLEKAEDLVGKTLWEMGERLGWDKTMIDQWREHDEEVMRSRQLKSIEEEIIWSDGKKRTFLSKKIPLLNQTGECVGILGMSCDITGRIEIENKLLEAKHQAEEANRAKTHFIANISHDIRTPLHTILGTAELLKIKQRLPDQEPHLDAIIQSGETLLKLVENILDFSTLEQEKMQLNDEPLDLLQLIKNAVATITHSAHEKGIEVIINHPHEWPNNLTNNAEAISRIVLNLLSNALKFTNAGQIVISLEVVDSTNHSVTLSLSIKDTGIGIAQHELKNIFDRFYRVNPAYKGKYKGAGLGLAITKKLVDNLKGSIRVESHLNVGSQFTVILPFKKISLGKTLSPSINGYAAANEKRQKKLSVLLVEDVPLIQKFSMDVMEMLGCEVTVANNAAEAVAFSKNNYDLIFMDIGLPDDDGLSVIRQFRKNKRHLQTPIVALTAHATDQVRDDCFAAGVNDFIAKPASYRTLLTCISKYAT